MFFAFKSEKRSEQSERENESIMVTKKIIHKKKMRALWSQRENVRT
jgi:hypothetical protein